MPGRVENKIVLITGGATGIGRAASLLFSRQGAKVAVADRNQPEGEKTVSLIRDNGGEACFIQADVSKSAQVAGMIDSAVTAFGGLNILINNAGINLPEGGKDDWNKVLDVNLHGAHIGIQSSIPFMQRAGGGSIINISSVSGLIGRKGSPYSYTASKGAIRFLSKGVAIDYAEQQIRCNTIIPGPVNTAMMQGVDPEIMKQRLSEIPLGRYGTPEDVAFAALFLASDESGWMTGAEIIIDGGITAQ